MWVALFKSRLCTRMAAQNTRSSTCSSACRPPNTPGIGGAVKQPALHPDDHPQHHISQGAAVAQGHQGGGTLQLVQAQQVRQAAGLHRLGEENIGQRLM